MSNTRELRRRIKSVKNTSQITKAMQMVAATKMRKAQNQAVNGRPYAGNLLESLSRLLPRVTKESNPLLSDNGVDIPGVVILSTDKGLVGALNTNIVRTLTSANLSTNTIFYTIGKKGRNFVARTGKDLKADFENSNVVTFRQAKQLAKLLIEAFLNKEIGEAVLVYPGFVSTLRQEVVKVKILPINIENVIPAFAGIQLNSPRSELDSLRRLADGGNDKGENIEFFIEPDPTTLLDELLIHFVEMRIYQSLLETKASEHSARMIAMKNATDNAKELVRDLQLTYNQTRQDAITRELLEITSAQAAME